MCGSTLSLILFYREKKMQRMIKDIKFTRWSEVKAAQSCPTLKSLSHVPPLTIQSMELFRPEYWDGQPLPSSGDLPNSGIEPRSPALQVYSLPAEPPGKPKVYTKEPVKLYVCRMHDYINRKSWEIQKLLKE